MNKKTRKHIKYPITISMAIHGVIFAVISLWSMNSSKAIPKKPPIHVKKIIFEKKKFAPARETKKIAPIKHPTAAAKISRKRPDTSKVKPKSFNVEPKPLNNLSPVTQVSKKTKHFQQMDVKPVAPATFAVHPGKPVHFESGKIILASKPALIQPKSSVKNFFIQTKPVHFEFGKKGASRNTALVQPKLALENISIQAKKPTVATSTIKTFTPKPFVKPFQIAAIPNDFVNDNSSENALSHLPEKVSPETKRGLPDSHGDDLNALRKGYSSQVWAKIADAKFYPKTARRRGMEGKPVVEFELRSDGQLINYFIALSSSSKILDKAAIDAVKNANPYPGIPKPLNLKSIRFKLPISFTLNEP